MRIKQLQSLNWNWSHSQFWKPLLVHHTEQSASLWESRACCNLHRTFFRVSAISSPVFCTQAFWIHKTSTGFTERFWHSWWSQSKIQAVSFEGAGQSNAILPLDWHCMLRNWRPTKCLTLCRKTLLGFLFRTLLIQNSFMSLIFFVSL